MKTLALVLALALTGCSTYKPLVDHKSSIGTNYDVDYVECENHAGTRIGLGHAAVAGAIIGGVLLAIVAPRAIRSDAVLFGAGAGALGFAGANQQERAQIMANCLRGRGYNVLN